MTQNSNPQNVTVLLCTVPNQSVANTLARTLVEEKFVACVSIIPGLRSVYRWKGEVCEDTELLLVMKTVLSRVDDVSHRVEELHPYETPEVVALPAVGGLENYLTWVREQVDT